ncbi:DinB family protein [Kutzneria sp. 744]|uniref:DinB family protein n=1 Tax=Kutzneria sp. (strain 744) TaxID=345341 RepID=UPI0003EEAD51|nr:DinB family protein [Kutzneria sp. 744]EWM12279.1 hypothetical protein KUTG_02583 [Kutzneria sp. 744]
MTDIAADLRRYLQEARDRLVSALDGLSEYDVRRPLTPSGTNLLGLVKHALGGEFGYLGDCVGRPAPVTLPWVEDGSIWDGADMWAKADESRAEILDLYRTAWKHSDESIERLGLDAPATVSWWAEEKRATTLGHLLTRVLADTAQHAGHADIVREIIDGRGGKDHDDFGGADYWNHYVAGIQAAADTHKVTGPVLVIGLDPARIPGYDPEPVQQAIARGNARFEELGIQADMCLVDPEDDPEGPIVEALGRKNYACVVVGGGIRRHEPLLPLFERVVNLVHQHQPSAAIAFNQRADDTPDAALRWL